MIREIEEYAPKTIKKGSIFQRVGLGVRWGGSIMTTESFLRPQLWVGFWLRGVADSGGLWVWQWGDH